MLKTHRYHECISSGPSCRTNTRLWLSRCRWWCWRRQWRRRRRPRLLCPSWQLRIAWSTRWRRRSQRWTRWRRRRRWWPKVCRRQLLSHLPSCRYGRESWIGIDLWGTRARLRILRLRCGGRGSRCWVSQWVPVYGVDDVIDKVPEGREDDQHVVYAQQALSPFEVTRGFVWVEVEQLEAAGVVEIVPVDLLAFHILAAPVWTHVLHFQIFIINPPSLTLSITSSEQQRLSL